MTVVPIQAISSIPSFSPTTNQVGVTDASSGTSGTDFATALGKGLDQVQAVQSNADSLAVQAATGDLTDISSYTVAATQASLVAQLVSTVRSTAISSFNEIMGMQA